MGRSITAESEDGVLSSDSPLNNDGDNFGGISNRGVVLKRGPWTSAEDAILVEYVKKHGEGNWNSVQKHTSLSRCGKSCRLRWANHLRPNLKKGAFTLEEERQIIELHAKMGNKWARMAAHLPGRTDNEIKNYWNTRIKRRQRAGLPMYPPELYLYALQHNETQLNSPGIYGGDQAYHGILQSNNYRAPDMTFDGFNVLKEIPGIPASMGNGFASSQLYGLVPQSIGSLEHAQESDEPMPDYENVNKSFQSFGMCYPYDADHTKKEFSSGVDHGIPFTSNVNFSASEHFADAQKSELPSLQYEETGLGVWESFNSLDQSPLRLPSHSPSPGSSGLLEDLVYGSKALGKSDIRSSEWATSSDINFGEIADGYIDTHSPSVHHVKSEVLDPNWFADGEREVDYSRPDAVLGSCWLEQSARVSKQTAAV